MSYSQKWFNKLLFQLNLNESYILHFSSVLFFSSYWVLLISACKPWFLSQNTVNQKKDLLAPMLRSWIRVCILALIDPSTFLSDYSTLQTLLTHYFPGSISSWQTFLEHVCPFQIISLLKIALKVWKTLK